MVSKLEDDADPNYTHFAHRDDFLHLLDGFLAVDLATDPSVDESLAEDVLVGSLGTILDFYLPSPGLLDPSLNDVLPPLLDKLSAQLTRLTPTSEPGPSARYVSPARLYRLARVISWVIKVRGYKAILPYFPSSIQYIRVLSALLSSHSSDESLLDTEAAWELRAVLLLWLSVLLTVPFSLSALSDDDADTPNAAAHGIDGPAFDTLFQTSTSPLTKRVILLALPRLRRPGREGRYAAILLSRIYSREDVVAALPGLFQWAMADLKEGDGDFEANFVCGVLEILALLPGLVKRAHLTLLREALDQLVDHLRGSRTPALSGLVRKLIVKAKGRWWLAQLKAKDAELEGVEEELDELMSGLADKDTIVRYSCAKYLARISALLPTELSSQIVAAVVALFGGTEDEPAIATSFGVIVDPGGSTQGGMAALGGQEVVRGEARWHGLCLALAEMARRGLIGPDAVGEVVDWVLKALTFDIRRASHSIGANVRDAAAYLLWSLARACTPDTIRPYADRVAVRLVAVACLDREVGVRRAASAAYQEGVGRLGLFPEGIDVLSKTDFYSVSVRRLAFEVAASSVAVHEVYRQNLREHLHHVSLRHWDPALRIQAASTLRAILALGGLDALQDSLDREKKELASLDANSVHGALAALRQMSELLSSGHAQRGGLVTALSTVRAAALVSPQAPEILQAACDLLSVCLTLDVLALPGTAGIVDRFLEAGTKRREASVQEAVGAVYARLSELKDCRAEILKLFKDLKSIRAQVKQCAILSLGCITFHKTPEMIDRVAKAVLHQLDPSTKTDVEGRRYALQAATKLVCQIGPGGEIMVDPALFSRTFSELLKALEDYSTDQRGDVGSWIRIAGLQSLGRLLAFTSLHQSTLIDESAFDQAVLCIVKQAVEKLEPVRAAAAVALALMRRSGVQTIWQWETLNCLTYEAPDDINPEGSFRLSDQTAWYASAMPLLETRYAAQLTAGLVHSTGSQIQDVADSAFPPFRDHLLASEPASRARLLDTVRQVLEDNFGANRVFIPCMNTLQRLFEDPGTRAVLTGHEAGLLRIACRDVAQIKSIERIMAAGELVSLLVGEPASGVRGEAVALVPAFLVHRYPRVRTAFAERLALALKDRPHPEKAVLDLLSSTDWLNSEELGAAAAEIARSLNSPE